MREVMAVIRMDKINRTKEALSAAGFSSFTATGRVLGRGRGAVDYELLQGAEAGYPEAMQRLGGGPRLIPKRVLTLVVPAEKTSLAVETIMSANRTGNPGDGKIFVLPVSDSFRVRTGETGAKIL